MTVADSLKSQIYNNIDYYNVISIISNNLWEKPVFCNGVIGMKNVPLKGCLLVLLGFLRMCFLCHTLVVVLNGIEFNAAALLVKKKISLYL